MNTTARAARAANASRRGRTRPRGRPNARDDLVAQISRLGESAHGDFVGRIYLRRMLDHVRDPDVRKIAWPK